MSNIPDMMFPVLGVAVLGLTTICVAAIVCWYKARDRELQIQREMRIREMEHERKLKEMEIEKAKLELEKAKAQKSV